MGSSRTITLFSVQTDERQRVSSVLLSVVAHVITIALVSIGVYEAKIGAPLPVAQYKVRQLDLETPLEALRSSAKPLEYKAPSKPASASAGGNPKVHAPALREVAKVEHGPQTLVQPDIHTHLVLKKKIPVPSLAIWQPVKVPVQHIVAPLPQQAVQMPANPTLNPPNQALVVRDVEVSPSQLPDEKLPFVASTTTPLALQNRNLPQPAPVTSSQSSSQPTPATVVSLSNLSMLSGKVILPPINETASSSTPGLIGSGAAKTNSTPGAGSGAGSGHGSERGPKTAARTGATTGEGSSGGDQGSQGEGSGSVSGTGNLTAAHISLPRQGRFGAVVVGNSLAGEFPEVSETWTGRVAYTVYLHVGLTKSWIMQYALPRAPDGHSVKQVAQLVAPWPYSIVRPNLTAGSIDGDALMIHGYVNKSGRFESLSVAFPPDFAQGNFVLNSLQQWQFRPATQNGQAARVEVLLIIPEDVYESGSTTPQPARTPAFVHTAGLPAMSVYSPSGHFRVFGSEAPGNAGSKGGPANRAR